MWINDICTGPSPSSGANTDDDHDYHDDDVTSSDEDIIEGKLL